MEEKKIYKVTQRTNTKKMKKKIKKKLVIDESLFVEEDPEKENYQSHIEYNKQIKKQALDDSIFKTPTEFSPEPFLRKPFFTKYKQKEIYRNKDYRSFEEFKFWKIEKIPEFVYELRIVGKQEFDSMKFDVFEPTTAKIDNFLLPRRTKVRNKDRYKPLKKKKKENWYKWRIK